MKLEITTPEEFMGDVIGDVSSKRGQFWALPSAVTSALLLPSFPCPNSLDMLQS